MSHERSNPYASPATALHDADDHDATRAALSRSERTALNVGAVVIAWERRRVWYNAFLVIASAPFAAALLIDSPSLGPQDVTAVIICAIVANVLYLAGPIVEGYWTWFLGPSKWMRNLLFFSGSLLAVVLALLTVRELLRT